MILYEVLWISAVSPPELIQMSNQPLLRITTLESAHQTGIQPKSELSQ